MDIRRRAAGQRRALVRVVAALVTGMLVAAACGGGGGGDDAGADDEDSAAPPSDGTTTTTDVLDNPRWANVVRGPQERDGEPRPGGSIVVAHENEANTYLPSAFLAGRSTFNVAYAIFDPLVARDADGELRPYLAESVDANDDFTEWTVRLRPGVRFHDGEPLDAHALKRIFDDYLAAEGAVTQVDLQSVDLEIVDEFTVRYVMTEPQPAFSELLVTSPGWPFSPDAADELGDAFGDQPVGTGPFKFVSWQRDGDLVVERNDDYWQDGQPYLDQITFRVIPDETTRANSLASGDVDAVRGGGLSSFAADVADIEGVEVALGIGNRANGVVFNTATPPTDDVRIRQALAHAVDQDALLRVAAGEAAELTEARNQFYPEGDPFYSAAVADAAPDHDPDEARRLYEEYLNDPGRSDGEEVGEPVTVTFTAPMTLGGAELASAFGQAYEQVGFDVTVDVVEPSTLVGTLLGHHFEALLVPGLGDSRSPLGEFEFYLSEPGDTLTNFSNFHDETVVDIIERLRTAGDVEDQVALAGAMGLHLAEQVPFHWLGSDLVLIAAQEGVEGITSWQFPDGTLGSGASPGVTFWGQVWLDGE